MSEQNGATKKGQSDALVRVPFSPRGVSTDDVQKWIDSGMQKTLIEWLEKQNVERNGK